MALDFSRAGLVRLLKHYGVRVVDEFVATSPEQAVKQARKLGFPVVLKVISDDIIHKTERGCVKLNLVNEQEVRTAYSQIMRNAGRARVEGVLVQKMVRPGTELIVGGKKDEQFGPLLLFGLGGIYVEIFRDVSIRVCPVTKAEAREMMGEIGGAAILKGARGLPSVDEKRLTELLVSISRLLYENQEICELDLNPVIAYEDGYLAVDVRAVRCVS